MLRKIRIVLAAVFYALITLLLLDFTGVTYKWMGWMAKMQFLPAVLALNVVVIVALMLLTLVFGRVYCSVICPLGVMQDLDFSKSRQFNEHVFENLGDIIVTGFRLRLTGKTNLADKKSKCEQ